METQVQSTRQSQYKSNEEFLFYIVKTIWAQNIAQTSMIDRSICITFLDNNCIITDDRYNSKV